MKPFLNKNFLDKYKDFYSIKSKIILSYKKIDKNSLYFLHQSFINPDHIKNELYDNVMNNHIPSRTTVKYIDPNINTESDLFLFNFVRDYWKSYKEFRNFKTIRKSLKKSKDTTSNLSYKKSVNKRYHSSKSEYLKNRIAYKQLFKQNEKLFDYYLTLAKMGISSDNIHLKQNPLF